jgi:hypothetical protein
MQIIDDLVALLDGYPELAFLAALPFFVAAVAFARHWAETWSARRRHRSSAGVRTPRRRLRFR